ncbi:hypothetical protein M1B72_05015 [Geomonas paludis]|uniref:Uncharacterized protein n=1 Tax=Geomonas paludis TaxID=2740185 RepID=A0A6V8MXI6_9BACT|nr:hypothetical protein [Geomonas paludis]UPU37071.1 hypothetical protein M1B72_05015 [Geomonas paludis]GFO64832.1 hypothetical protein GMPD_27510 [Geomonas paludis]
MRRKMALLGLIAATCNCPEVFAEAVNEEVVFHRSLFSVGDVYQSASVSYGYTAHSAGKVSTSSQNLAERYGISTDLAILDPDVVLVDLSGGVSYQQRLGNSNASLLDYSYNIMGRGFRQSYHPMQLSSVRSSSTISTGYLPSYSVDRTFNKFSASLLHRSFPVYMYLTNSTVTTRGLTNDTTTDTNSGGLSVHHNGGWYLSDGTVNFSTSSAAGTESRVYSATQNNTIDLDAAKKYRLITKASLSDMLFQSTAETVQQRIGFVSGSFSGQLGKALATSLSSDYNYSSTQDFQGKKQTIQSTNFSAGLAHSLYQSLNTSVGASYGKTYALGGGQDVVNGTATLAYRKQLPAQGQLSLRGSVAKSVTHQDFADTLLPKVLDEPHTVRQGDTVTLTQDGKLVGDVKITSVDEFGATIVWVAETDYHVDYTTGRIQILRAMDPTATVAILVSYQVGVNKNVDYTTDTQNYQALLALLGGRYSFAANYATSSEHRISGDAATSALNSTTSVTVSGIARYETNTYSLEYGKVTTTSEEVSHVGAAWTYDSYLGGRDHVRVSARDTYSMHAATSAQSGYDQNIFSASATYSQSLFQQLRAALMCNLSDTRTGNTVTDVVGVRTSLDGSFNSLSFSLTAGTRYYFSSGPTTRDTDVNLQITRNF